VKPALSTQYPVQIKGFFLGTEYRVRSTEYGVLSEGTRPRPQPISFLAGALSARNPAVVQRRRRLPRIAE
jgi:hypothetical protein